MGTRSTNTEAGVDNKQKQTHADLHDWCAFKLHARKGKFQVLDGKKKTLNVTFNEFYYIAFTHNAKTRQTLWSRRWGGFLEILVDVSNKKRKTIKNCTALYF